MELKRWMSQPREVLAVDTETEGLNWTKDRIRLIQVGDIQDGWAMRWDMWGGAALEVLQRYEGRVVYHNAKFDTHMLDRWAGWSQPRHLVDDTMVMAHIMDSTRPVGLKPLTTFHVDRRAAALETILDEAKANNGWTWATIPFDFAPYWQYGALDCVLAAHLWHIFKPQVTALAPKAYDLEMSRTWVVQRQERLGIKVDRTYTEQKLYEFMTYVDQAAAWCEQTYGVSAGSDAKIIERLEQDGISFSKLTPSGSRYALDKEVLEGIIAATRHPLAETILQRRRLQKLASTYLSNFLSMSDSYGILHPNVKVLGARTSRESVTEPALQTLPRKSEANAAAITVRNCVTARDEEHTLVMCDFAQIEFRMFAHFTRDPGLIGAFAEGDFFVNVTRELWNDTTIQKSDERRQSVKNGMYALGYGAGAEKIALTTGQTLDAVMFFLDQLNARYPGIKLLQRQVQNVALHRAATEGIPYVVSPLTGRRHVADEGKEYALVNYLVQGTAAEVFKMKTVELSAAGLDEFMVLGVHDEVVFDVPNDRVEEIKPVIKEIMTDDQFAVPLTVEVSTAFRWGEAQK